MSGRRVLVLYGSLLLGFAVVLCRLFWLCSNTAYAARAEAQSTATLTFPARRGNFYDCNGHLLTGLGEQWLALSLPGEGSYTKLYPYASKAGQAMLYQNRNASRPFLVEVPRDVSAMGAWCYAVPRRYGDAPLASALLGYLDGEGHGVAGLEAVLEDLLSGPEHLHPSLSQRLPAIRAMAKEYPESQVKPNVDDFPAIQTKKPPFRGRRSLRRCRRRLKSFRC